MLPTAPKLRRRCSGGALRVNGDCCTPHIWACCDKLWNSYRCLLGRRHSSLGHCRLGLRAAP
eukprot:11205766-Lingulodinium_polyedra.AAC.1